MILSEQDLFIKILEEKVIFDFLELTHYIK